MLKNLFNITLLNYRTKVLKFSLAFARISAKDVINMEFLEALKARRSIYQLSKALPVSEAEVVRLVEDVMSLTPSAFNMQSARAIVLFGEEHTKLWQIVTDTLKKVVPADKFAPTQEKMDAFSAGAGTILFFENDAVVEKFKADFPLYAEAFDMFAAHGLGIAQGNVWNALADAGIGANLQHYNPLIDDAVKAAWQVPDEYRLVSQMVFGKREENPEPKEKLPASERVKAYGLA